MPAFFAHNRGSVVRVTAQHNTPGGLLPFRIVVQDTELASPFTRAIITQAGILENGNYQFMHTLNETVYAYVFGDRIGELRLSGLCFTIPCPDFAVRTENDNDGFQQISRMYRDFRIANVNGPVGISFGAIDYKGFLVGMNLEVIDAERNLGQWAFRFNTFPGNRQ